MCAFYALSLQQKIGQEHDVRVEKDVMHDVRHILTRTYRKLKKHTAMKTINRLYTLLAAVTMVFAMTSCDEDPWHEWDYYDYSEDWYDDYNWYDDAFNYGTEYLNQEAAALRGYWTGNTELHYYDHGVRKVTQMESLFEFDQYNPNSLNGRGRETDKAPKLDAYGNYVYDNNGELVYDYQELRFSWYIDPRSGDINIKYDDSGVVYTAEFDDFSLNTQSGQFYGKFECDEYDEELRFNLLRTTLAKPNDNFADADGTSADSTTAAKGTVFGRLKGDCGTFNSPMGLRKNDVR